MKANYQHENSDGEWIDATIDTENLDNDSGAEWTEYDLEYHVKKSHQQNQESIRNFEIA